MPVKSSSRPKVRRITKDRRASVSREEFNRLLDELNVRGDVINRLVQDQQIQFQRIAQMQAELDRLKQVCAGLKREV